MRGVSIRERRLVGSRMNAGARAASSRVRLWVTSGAEDSVLCAKSLQPCPTSLAHKGCWSSCSLSCGISLGSASFLRSCIPSFLPLIFTWIPTFRFMLFELEVLFQWSAQLWFSAFFFCYRLYLAPAANLWVSSPPSAQGWVYWLPNREYWMRNVLLSSNSSNSNFSFKYHLFMYLSIHLSSFPLLPSFLFLSSFLSFILEFFRHWSTMSWSVLSTGHVEVNKKTKQNCVELIFQQRR